MQTPLPGGRSIRRRAQERLQVRFSAGDAPRKGARTRKPLELERVAFGAHSRFQRLPASFEAGLRSFGESSGSAGKQLLASCPRAPREHVSGVGVTALEVPANGSGPIDIALS